MPKNCLLGNFGKGLRDYNHFETSCRQTGRFGGMYGCFWWSDGVTDGHRWVMRPYFGQTRWFDAKKSFIGEFRKRITGL